MSSTRIERLLRRISPEFVTRSYLAEFAVAVVIVVAAIGAVGAVTCAETTEQLEANARDDYAAVAELSGIELDVRPSERRATAREAADNDAFDREANTVAGYLTSHVTRTADEVIAVHHVDRSDGTVLASTSNADGGIN